MEYEVGEIFEFDGKKYQVIEDNGFFCDNYYFDYSTCKLYPIGHCTRYFRKDRKSVIFKLIEK